MELQDVEELIKQSLTVTHIEVFQPRGVEDDDHLGAIVVSPDFEGKSLVDQHQLVYESLGDHMTTDIHALELKTYTPEEFDQ